MFPKEENHIPLGRRDFVLAALLFPFLVNASMTDLKIAGENLIASDMDTEFIILGDWVFLKTDLVNLD